MHGQAEASSVPGTQGGHVPVVQCVHVPGAQGVHLQADQTSVAGGEVGNQPSEGTTDANVRIEHLGDVVAQRSGRQERTTCFYRGYKHTRAWASSRKVVFRCSKFRQGCRGTMEYTITAMGYSSVRPHTCRSAVIASSIVNVALAIERVALPARQIWEDLRNTFYSSDNANVVRGLSEEQVLRRVYRARNLHFSGDVHGAVEIPPLSLALNGEVSFFRFHHVTINHQNLNKPTRLLGWAHPSLVNLLRYHGTTLFVGGTFRCVPRGYKQCVVFMVHDRASGIFVPVFYVLGTSRTGDSYWDMMHFVVQATDQQIEPAEIICDFEPASMNAVQTQFPNAIVLGCLFHLKQALRRAMKRFSIPEEECAIAMTRGVVDMLTVINPAQIEQGIKWVKQEIRQRCAETNIPYSKPKWRGFWGYFARTWLEQYEVDTWNVFGLDNQIIARTNNPLERFNREIIGRFPTPHPSMTTFVSTIKVISAEYVRRLADVPRGCTRRAPRETIQLPVPVEISDDDTPEVEEQTSDDSSDDEQTSLTAAP